MQRIYEEKRLQLERGSIGGSYFMVQLPDGKMEKRMKLPLNADPGVHSSLALDQLAQQTLQPVPTLPTITESKVQESMNAQSPTNDSEPRKQVRPPRPHRVSESDNTAAEQAAKNMPRNASQPAFTQHHQGVTMNF